MLADLGHHDGAVGVELARKLLHDRFRNDAVGVLHQVGVVERVATAPLGDLNEPRCGDGLGARLRNRLVDAGEHAAKVADNGDLHLADLADLGRVDVDMDDFGVRGELGELAGHAVGEARAACDDQVGLGHGKVCVLRAVHAHGTDVERVGSGERALAHERGDHGQLQRVRQLDQLIGGTGADHAAADVEHGALGALHALDRCADLLGVAAVGGAIRGQVDLIGIVEHHLLRQDIGGDVDQHRAGTAGCGDMERLAEGGRQLIG